MNITATYPNFEHEANNLTKYIEGAGTFSILLKNGSIVHFKPISAENFRIWLKQNDIPIMRDW